MNRHGNLDFREKVLEQVKRIVLGNLAGKAAKVYLFGSWARGEEKRSSDIDVAIELDLYASEVQTVFMNLRHALEDSTVPYKVDVVHLNTADEIIVNKVRKEGIVWGGPMNE